MGRYGDLHGDEDDLHEECEDFYELCEDLNYEIWRDEQNTYNNFNI